MKKLVRTMLVAAVLGGSMFVAAPPASATCHPEKPSTCETEFPDVQEILDACYSNIETGLPPIGVCGL